jgi:hypothetical protein
MRQRGREALYAQPQRRQPSAGHKIAPSLVWEVQSERGHPVWSTASTALRFQHGGIDLVAVLDWGSRDVLSWAVSLTREGPCGVEALEPALRGGRPAIFHPDQGAQCTQAGRHRATQPRRAPAQHGWPWPGAGQRVCGAPVAHRPGTRRGLSGRTAPCGRRRKGSGAPWGFTTTSVSRGVERRCPSDGMAGGEARTIRESSPLL